MKSNLTIPLIAFFLGYFAVLCTAAPDQQPGKVADQKPNGADAKAASAKWLDGLQEKGLVLNETVKNRGFVVTYDQGALGRVTKFVLQESGYQVSLAFHGELSETTPLHALKEKFWYVTLDLLPTPGLELPGWEVRPQTPTSSVEKGVEIHAYGDGKIKLQVKTKCFALYGRDPSIVAPADAASPDGSFFQIRKEFPLDLTIEAPFAFR